MRAVTIHPESLTEIARFLETSVREGLDRAPRTVTLQTRTLRYNQAHWVEVLGLERHWYDTRVDAEIFDNARVRVATQNVTELRLSPSRKMAGWRFEIDGETVEVPDGEAFERVTLRRIDERWRLARDSEPRAGLRKKPGLQGPIDDVFLEPFLVVKAGGRSKRPHVQKWVDFESARFEARWPELFRGDLRTKLATEVTGTDLERFHLILWGDAASNQLIARILDGLPLDWNSDHLSIKGERPVDAATHVPLLIYPNPLNPEKYVVLNSGPTFREGHDRTNSLQNPRLPDWAVVNVTQPPDALWPGKVVAAGFFAENWLPSRAFCEQLERHIASENR